MIIAAVFACGSVFYLTRGEAKGEKPHATTVEKTVALVMAMLFLLDSVLIFLGILVKDAVVTKFAAILAFILWIIDMIYLISIFIILGSTWWEYKLTLVVQCVKFIFVMCFLYFSIVLYSYSVYLDEIQRNGPQFEETPENEV